jgi:molybdate transport system substrate-binding protein
MRIDQTVILRKLVISAAGVLLIPVLAFADYKVRNRPLVAFVGAASKPATELAAKRFEEKTGIKVDLTFGGSGQVLSQMMLAGQGDLYFPGSSDYMELAKKKGAVLPETERIIVYLVSTINVQRGNPRDIKTLADLLKPGLKVAIANPENVCVGAYAVEIIMKNFTREEKAAFRRNLVNYTESCEKTATAVSLKMADAVIGWEVFEHWDPDRIETVSLKPAEIQRVGYIPIAVSAYSKNRELAQQFIDFLLSEEGKAAFKEFNYLMTPQDAFAYIGAEKPVGGEYVVPEEWTR